MICPSFAAVVQPAVEQMGSCEGWICCRTHGEIEMDPLAPNSADALAPTDSGAARPAPMDERSQMEDTLQTDQSKRSAEALNLNNSNRSAKSSCEPPPLPLSSGSRIGSNDNGTPVCDKGSSVSPNSVRSPSSLQSRKVQRSKSTEGLKTSVAEWWVLKPHAHACKEGLGFNMWGEIDVEAEEEDLEHPKPTWCGDVPKAPDGKLTSLRQRGMFAPVRRYAAGQRHRYEWNGFDLDLAYVTSRAIAMGFPGRGVESTYRNSHSEVARFLKWRHKDKYRIYNLCVEKSHADNGFPAETVRFPCSDHSPPQLTQILAFCKDTKEWLTADPMNVVVVHCKAGKGRTGSMLCALLVYAGAMPSTYDALRWYEWIRGGKRSGVTIPAQIRWVAMLERWLHKGSDGLSSDPMGRASPHTLRSVTLGPFHESFLGVNVAVSVGLATREDLREHKVGFWFPTETVEVDKDRRLELRDLEGAPVWTVNDGQLVIEVRQIPKGGCCNDGGVKLKLSAWWQHAYLQRRKRFGESVEDLLQLQLSKPFVDGMQADMVKHKKTPASFQLTAVFHDLDGLTSM
mmetsp:Transcript_72299/g.186463  ORF Transcript_72299/g.186463 Transcript_72299/m.186463 type:complete len:569 (-) Transcript_72299:54-1760(-)